MRSVNARFYPRTRWVLTAGKLALPVGILHSIFVHPTNKVARNWLHGVSGMLLGFSIAINLVGLRFARGCRERQS